MQSNASTLNYFCSLYLFSVRHYCQFHRFFRLFFYFTFEISFYSRKRFYYLGLQNLEKTVGLLLNDLNNFLLFIVHISLLLTPSAYLIFPSLIILNSWIFDEVSSFILLFIIIIIITPKEHQCFLKFVLLILRDFSKLRFFTWYTRVLLLVSSCECNSQWTAKYFLTDLLQKSLPPVSSKRLPGLFCRSTNTMSTLSGATVKENRFRAFTRSGLITFVLFSVTMFRRPLQVAGSQMYIQITRRVTPFSIKTRPLKSPQSRGSLVNFKTQARLFYFGIVMEFETRRQAEGTETWIFVDACSG